MYPLKFKPVFQKRMWGANRLRTLLGKTVENSPGTPIGESWELADLPPGTVQADSSGAAPDGSLSSTIANGPLAGRTLHDAITQSPTAILGPSATPASRFPLLIKFLDAQTNLSVQVHPDARYAAAHPGAHLKSEAWYILHADPGAKIYKGLRTGVTRDQFKNALESGEVEPLLNAIKVRPGDCHYLQSGTVHALGAGILAAEVQTPSDTTFRVFDWNRLGPDGKPRTLHIDQALECIDFSSAPTAQSHTGRDSRLVTTDFFTLDRFRLAQGASRDIPSGESRVWIILHGQAVINAKDAPPTALVRGDTVLLPAGLTSARISTVADCTWLEARIVNPGGAAS